MHPTVTCMRRCNVKARVSVLCLKNRFTIQSKHNNDYIKHITWSCIYVFLLIYEHI